jgi:hypothetical protein
VTAALAAACMLAAACLLAGRPAKAEELPATPVPDSELAEMRGGFIVADGVQFDFGAKLTATVNGQLAFQTQVTFTPSGPHITETLGQNVVQGTSVPGTIKGLGQQGFSPQDIALMNQGATALIQKVTGGSVQNIVINTANNQNIQQSTQLQLNLPSFAQAQQLFQQNLAVLHLLQNGQVGLTGAGH